MVNVRKSHSVRSSDRVKKQSSLHKNNRESVLLTQSKIVHRAKPSVAVQPKKSVNFLRKSSHSSSPENRKSADLIKVSSVVQRQFPAESARYCSEPSSPNSPITEKITSFYRKRKSVQFSEVTKKVSTGFQTRKSDLSSTVAKNSSLTVQLETPAKHTRKSSLGSSLVNEKFFRGRFSIKTPKRFTLPCPKSPLFEKITSFCRKRKSVQFSEDNRKTSTGFQNGNSNLSISVEDSSLTVQPQISVKYARKSSCTSSKNTKTSSIQKRFSTRSTKKVSPPPSSSKSSSTSLNHDKKLIHQSSVRKRKSSASSSSSKSDSLKPSVQTSANKRKSSTNLQCCRSSNYIKKSTVSVNEGKKASRDTVTAISHKTTANIPRISRKQSTNQKLTPSKKSSSPSKKQINKTPKKRLVKSLPRPKRQVSKSKSSTSSQKYEISIENATIDDLSLSRRLSGKKAKNTPDPESSENFTEIEQCKSFMLPKKGDSDYEDDLYDPKQFEKFKELLKFTDSEFDDVPISTLGFAETTQALKSLDSANSLNSSRKVIAGNSRRNNKRKTSTRKSPVKPKKKKSKSKIARADLCRPSCVNDDADDDSVISVGSYFDEIFDDAKRGLI